MVTTLSLAAYRMAIYSVVFQVPGNAVGLIGKHSQTVVQIIGHQVETEFSPKRLDKPISQAKIPPISGTSHLCLTRPTVTARVYDSNPAVATPREEQCHE
jgi:hypothetical protein